MRKVKNMLKIQRYITMLILLLGVFHLTLNKVQASQKSEQKEDYLSPEEISDDGLPKDIHERDRFLSVLYNETIPLFLSWVKGNEGYPWRLWKELEVTNFDLQFPFPYNPYRVPGTDKINFFPTNNREWTDVISSFKRREETLGMLIKNIEELLAAAKLGPLKIIDTDLDAFKSLITTIDAYTAEAFQKHKQLEEQAKNVRESRKITLNANQIDNIEHILRYYQNELKKCSYFISLVCEAPNSAWNTTPKKLMIRLSEQLPSLKSSIKSQKPLTSEQEELKNAWNKIKPYFLSGRKPAHELINVKPLQEKAISDTDVIVYESKHIGSKRLVYSPFTKYTPPAITYGWGDNERRKENIQSLKEGEQKSHSTAVAGVLAATEDLQHLKGVAPAARVLIIEDLSPYDLELIKKSNARVINMSMGLYTRLSKENACQKYFEDRLSYTPIGQKQEPESGKIVQQRIQLHDSAAPGDAGCAQLWNFAQLIQERDLLLVQSAGNEGLQKENINWKTGEIPENLTNSAKGISPSDVIEEEVSISLFDRVFTQIPQLRNRLILVGNLREDGVTIHPASDLPGSFPKDFIFAPSGDIASLHPSEVDWGSFAELGPVTGTSGAAPRVSGVAVLLGRLFPDLPMTEIRECILDSGDPFWLSPNNKFIYLKDICETPQIDKNDNAVGSKINFSDPNWRLKLNSNEQSFPICPNSYAQRIFGQGRVNAMAAYYKCFDKNEKLRKEKGMLPEIEIKSSSKNPLAKIVLAVEPAIPESIQEIKTYYETHPQRKIMNLNSRLISPLEAAVELEDKVRGLVKILLDSQNKPVVTKEEAVTIMYKAIKNEKVWWNFPIELYQYLLQQGIDVNKVVDAEGNTLLHWAALRGCGDAAEILLKQPEIDINIKNVKGETPKDIATGAAKMQIHVYERKKR